MTLRPPTLARPRWERETRLSTGPAQCCRSVAGQSAAWTASTMFHSMNEG